MEQVRLQLTLQASPYKEEATMAALVNKSAQYRQAAARPRPASSSSSGSGETASDSDGDE